MNNFVQYPTFRTKMAFVHKNDVKLQIWAVN